VAVFRPWDKHAFRMGYGLAFRKPSYLEGRLHTAIEEYNTAMPEIQEVMATQIGNENLVNEQVHTLEAGWQAHFVEDRLRVSVDLFYNRYQNIIVFWTDIAMRLGLPDLHNSFVEYRNMDYSMTSYGAELQVVYRSAADWNCWGNLGLRDGSSESELDNQLGWPDEPAFKVNLGGGYRPESGLRVDLAMHFSTEYRLEYLDPVNILSYYGFETMGPNLLMIGRVGYLVKLGADRKIELGLTVRTPLMESFREYPGAPMPLSLQLDDPSDFGGEKLLRLVALYLRGSL